MYYKLILISISALLLAACSIGSKTQQLAIDTSQTAFIELRASKQINPNNWNESSPVAVQLYQLRDNKLFEAGSFGELYNRANDILGNDLIAQQQLILQPGERYRLTQILSPDTQYIGIVAAFRDVSGNDWRTSVATIEESKSMVQIQLTGKRVLARIIPFND